MLYQIVKFTVISHAGLYIEHKQIKLLIDPWIIGSCYWRSWWNYPEPSSQLVNSLKPTHIYITHLHWDHYHGPSLRLFEDLQPKVLFPKHFAKRLVGDCRKDFKFKNIYEIDHGRTLHLSEDFKITSYQFNPGFIDSSLVIEADGMTILDANDTKTFGLSLKQILSNHRKIDFVLRSHSSASPLPHCIKGSKPEETSRSKLAYASEFSYFCSKTKAKYAIPFASSHYYLHENTRKYNKYYSNPNFVKSVHEEIINQDDQKCVLMPSGSSFSKKYGFKLIDHNYNDIDEHIKQGIEKHSKKLNKQSLLSNKLKINKVMFHRYFKEFFSATKFPFSIDFNYAYLVNESKHNSVYLCAIYGKDKTTKVIEINNKKEIYNYGMSFVIELPIYVFNDLNAKKMHNTFSPSKHLEITLIKKNSLKELNKLLSIVDLYENDCLPLYKLINIRCIKILFRRWRELIDILIFFYKIKVLKQELKELYI